jgi:hydrogenase expression/formation protein HypD
MKLFDAYRDGALAQRYLRAIERTTTRSWNIMEVCGGQTHSIVRYGLDQALPSQVTLIHGPGCPVCVTPAAFIDKAVELAGLREVILCSFGDMLRVPGTRSDLQTAKAGGADVRVVYSPLDALALARAEPGREVVFFAVGFETTAPANAMAVYQAAREKLDNFSMLVCHVLVPPALEAILDEPEHEIDGFLAAGHVCTVMGYSEYEPIAARYGVPIVVTGFEPVDILAGVYFCVRQLEAGQSRVENQYRRCVRRAGNVPARRMLETVFEIVPRRWRGIGDIPQSGLGLAPAYRGFDAEQRFGPIAPQADEAGECISALVLRGQRKPVECPAFGTRCTPEHPLGVTMVSSEGACAAYYRYRGRSAAGAA